MNRTFLILTCLILAVLIESVYSRRERVNFRADGHKHTSASESASAEGSNSWEDEYNPYDRAIGFGKGGNKGSKYEFAVTVQKSYTQAPEMFSRLKGSAANEIDDVDKDYYAHYDFEFAKSGTNNANFQQKFIKHQANHIGKPLVNPKLVIVDEGLGGFSSKKDVKPQAETNARSGGGKGTNGLVGGITGDGSEGSNSGGIVRGLLRR